MPAPSTTSNSMSSKQSLHAAALGTLYIYVVSLIYATFVVPVYRRGT